MLLKRFLLGGLLIVSEGMAATGGSESTATVGPMIYIKEYRIQGVRQLSPLAIEEAVYPFLGPDRTRDDVEMARAALEKTYRDNGYQTVSVQVPPQEPKDGIVLLQVVEAEVGRLRVKGARYVSPEKIKAHATSLAEGKVINFNEVPGDIAGLNQLPGRQVTPSLRAGVEPGTVDVDLEVKDRPPIHASVELNNRSGPQTRPLRLNGAISDDNLWQLGHTAGLNFQVSPQDTRQVRVFSGYYLARFEGTDQPSLMLQGSKQDSNVSTLGNAAVIGRNETLGLRVIVPLPSDQHYFQSVSAGLDYKHLYQRVHLAGDGGDVKTPATYYPLSASYSATVLNGKNKTEINAEVDFHLRGMGSAVVELDASRYHADGGFIYFRGDLAHTQELPLGLQAYGKIQGQIANQPLLSLEQFTGGGLGTVRGYLEGEASGDNGLIGTFELRSPNLANWLGKTGEWRLYGFLDGGTLTVIDALPAQKDHFWLASYGFGTRFSLWEHFSGSLDVGIPFYKQGETKPHEARLSFRAGLEY